MAIEPLEPIDETQAKQEVGTALVRASAVNVDDEGTWYQARTWRRDLDLLHKRAEKWFKEIKAPMNKAIQTIRDKEKEIIEPAEQAIELLDSKILDFEKHRAKNRAQLQIGMEYEARIRAQDARADQIQNLLIKNDIRGAEELERQPLFVPNIVLPDDFVPLPGEGRKSRHRVKEEVDIIALAAAVASGQLPMNAIEPNFTILNNLAEAVGLSGKIPGCGIIEVTTITQRQ